ncbi:MAG TPA: MerR family transcriptional regulator [Mycobacteriales bacterium]|nr:MerR family transcriptional regulator [Mycobacteriales bacterium]
MQSVGQVAAATGVSVRTLHHWDHVGLVSPAMRRPNGYRAYGDDDVARVRTVVAWRELGLSLEDIRSLLQSGATTAVLEEHLQLLETEGRRVARMRAAVERALEARRMGIELDPAEVREVFGDQDPTEHAAEAEKRWGGTAHWAESQRRTSSYTKEDWLRMRAEQDDLEARMAEAMSRGEGGEDLANEHRQLITRWFHDVPVEMHLQLAEMYVEDERFRAHYDRRAPGLAQWLRNAIVEAHA